MTEIKYHCLPWNKNLGYPAQQAKVNVVCIACNEMVELELDVPDGFLEVEFRCPLCDEPRSRPAYSGYLPKDRDPKWQEEFTLLTEWDITAKKYSILSGPIDEDKLPKITEDPNKIYKFEKWNEAGNPCSTTPVHYNKRRFSLIQKLRTNNSNKKL